MDLSKLSPAQRAAAIEAKQRLQDMLPDTPALCPLCGADLSVEQNDCNCPATHDPDWE